MADISKIKLPSGVTYDIKDTVAREAAAGAIILKGGCITDLTDGSTTKAIKLAELQTEEPSDWASEYTSYYQVDATTKKYVHVPAGSGAPTWEANTYYSEKSYTAKSSDAVIYGVEEYVFDGTIWHKFGDFTGLGDFAYADTGSVTFTGGTNDSVLGADTTFENASSAVTFTGGTDDSVLGADTTFTNGSSSVSFAAHTTATCLTSSVTATVPKTASTTKYLTAGTALGTETSTQGADTPMWGASVDANETLSFTFKPMSTTLTAGTSTSSGAVTYTESVSESGTNSVTFDTTTSGTTAAAITALGAATAAAQTITVGTNDQVTAVTGIGTGTAAAQTITVGTNDQVTAVTSIGTGTVYPTTT